jgi:F-type H+-transporting ATPase subunit delta
MNESIISVRYSKAIFLLALEKGVLDKVKSDMEIIFSIMSESKELQNIFQNPVLKPSKKQEIIKKGFPGFDPMTLSFINLVIKNRREIHLFDISRNFLTKYKQHYGIESAIFTTAVNVEPMMLKKVKDLIKIVLKTEVELANKIDKNIIGGFIIRVGDKQIDSSVKSSLNITKKKLLNTSVEFNK